MIIQRKCSNLLNVSYVLHFIKASPVVMCSWLVFQVFRLFNAFVIKVSKEVTQHSLGSLLLTIIITKTAASL